LTKRYDDPIEVELAGTAFQPVAFTWRGRRYSVDRLLKHWRQTAEAWDPERRSDLDCYRVEALGGVQRGTYDLRLDRLAGRKQPQWRLARVWD
jgi:hypothetical protein